MGSMKDLMGMILELGKMLKDIDIDDDKETQKLLSIL
jgi:hypothetical protein